MRPLTLAPGRLTTAPLTTAPAAPPTAWRRVTARARQAAATALVAAAALSAALSAACADDDAPTAPGPTTRERQVAALVRSFETGDRSALSVINPGKYIQHNLSAPDGFAGLLGFLDALPRGAVRATPVRVFEDGDFVVAHSSYVLFGPPQTAFDVYRYENGRVVEHWDNLEVTAGPNPSGHTMIDGPTEPRDLGRTAANKALARAYVTAVLVNTDPSRVAEFVDPGYVEHNPLSRDGVPALTAAFQTLFAPPFSLRFTRIHAVLGKGDLALVISEGVRSGRTAAFYDLYRVANGRIAEHWDVIQEILPREQWQHQNGKFGF